MKRIFDPTSMQKKDLHQLILGSVAPRPIAFVSSYDEDDVPNLAPYSFFMGISSNPPLVAFSSSSRGPGSSFKDTLHNAYVHKELVINTVHYDMVWQMAISSISFDRSIDEFKKAGLTAVPAQKVKAPLLKEAHINMECKVRQIISFGDEAGSGNLVICDVLLVHVNEDILGDKDRISPYKADLMGRLGRAYYTRVNEESIYTIYQSRTDDILGFDRLPDHIKESTFLTANEISQMAKLLTWPSDEKINHWRKHPPQFPERKARQLILEGNAADALALLISQNK